MDKPIPRYECQRLLKIGSTKFYELVNSGELQAVKLGRKTYVLESEISKFLANLRAYKASHSKEA